MIVPPTTELWEIIAEYVMWPCELDLRDNNVKTTVYTHVNGDRTSHIENSKN